MSNKKKILVIQKVHDKGMELINNHPDFDVEPPKLCVEHTKLRVEHAITYQEAFKNARKTAKK